jgi:hypothetical protein
MRNAIFVIIGLWTISSVSQSAWTQKKGEAYLQVSYSTIGDYSGIYGNPDYASERKISDNTLQFYGEYGVSAMTTVVLGMPFKLLKAGSLVTPSANPLTTRGSKNALGNVVVGLKHRFPIKDWVVSGQMTLEAQTGTFDAGSGLRTGYDTWMITPTLNIGKSFKGVYVQGYTGFDLRFRGYSSNFKLGAELGVRPMRPLLLIAYINSSQSFKNGDIQLPQSNLLTALYVNDQEYVAYGLKAIGEITPNFGLLFGYAGALSGNNVPKREVLSFGIYQKF